MRGLFAGALEGGRSRRFGAIEPGPFWMASRVAVHREPFHHFGQRILVQERMQDVNVLQIEPEELVESRGIHLQFPIRAEPTYVTRGWRVDKAGAPQPF